MLRSTTIWSVNSSYMQEEWRAMGNVTRTTTRLVKYSRGKEKVRKVMQIHSRG